jgi:hypothetical protein
MDVTKEKGESYYLDALVLVPHLILNDGDKKNQNRPGCFTIFFIFNIYRIL